MKLKSDFHRHTVYRCVLGQVAIGLLTGLLFPHTGVYGHPSKNCNIRTWYVDMLADGHLTDSLTGEQLVAKSELEGMLKQAKLDKNNMVSCDILQKYSNIFKTQDDEPVIKNTETKITDIEHDVPSSEEDAVQDTKVNMDTIDETEFGDETEFSSDDNIDVITDSKVTNVEEKENIALNMKPPYETNRADKITKKKTKIKSDTAKVHISSLVWGICFRNRSYMLQHLLEVRETNPVNTFTVEEQNILQERSVLYPIRNVTDIIVCKLRRRCSNYCYYMAVIKQSRCFPEYSLGYGSSDEKSNGQNTSVKYTKEPSIQHNIQHSRADDSDSSVQSVDTDSSLKGDNSNKHEGDVNLNVESITDKGDGPADEPATTTNCQTTSSPNFDFVKFEQQFTLKANEYETKIQSLEIMIIRLENRLLSEKLSQQNDTGSFARLENQILKVENELLKLNQSYFVLRDENEMLKKRQGKYLELAHVKSQSSDNTNTSKQHEMISQQHFKIIQLKTLLQNHSNLFDKLQRKHVFLEEQNQILHQIVMNQTAIISNIMKKMQEIADDNNKQRHETQSLKAKLDIQTTSTDILEKLEHLVSDKMVTSPRQVNQAKEEKEHNIPQTKKFFPENPASWFGDKTKLQCQGNKSPRYCFLYSIILSPCPPFSPIYWNKCPFLLKRMPTDDPAHQNQNKEPNLDTVRDAVRIQQQPTITDNKKTPQSQTKAQSTTAADHTVPINSLGTKDGKPEKKTIENDDQKQNINKQNENVMKNKKPDEKHNELGSKELNTDRKDTEGKKKAIKTDDAADTSSNKKQTPETRKVAGTAEQLNKKKTENINSENKIQNKADSNSNAVNVVKQKVNVTEKPRKILYPAEAFDKAKDCYSLYEQGHSLNKMYRVHLVGTREPISVFCDMRRGGWTVIMKRVDGSVKFNRDWYDYKTGFGGVYTEHWIGNDNLHYLTNQDYYTLRVEIMDWERERRYAEYDDFWVDDEDANYRLHIGGYRGDAGDGFFRHSGMMFSTYDSDNDLLKETQMGGSCAKRFKGGGWYYRCYNNNLFGIYYHSENIPAKHFDGITWKPWKGPNNSMKEVVLKIRPRHARDL